VTEWLVNNKLDRMWKEAFMAWFKALSKHLFGMMGKPQKFSFKRTHPWAKILIWEILNMK